MRIALIVPLLLGMLNCATVTPEQRAAAGKIKIMKADPENNCEEKGAIRAISNWNNQDEIRASMRIQAARMGANYIRLEAAQSQYATGTAFLCPEAPAPTSTASTAQPTNG